LHIFVAGDNFLGGSDLSGIPCPQALHFAIVMFGGIFSELIAYDFLQFGHVICIGTTIVIPEITHWVKRLYKNDEDRIPLIKAGWEFFNPER
jgi:hypothetical protein